jgi:hypothetical protein
MLPLLQVPVPAPRAELVFQFFALIFRLVAMDEGRNQYRSYGQTVPFIPPRANYRS